MASEYHVAWICPRLSTLRRDIGINNFKNSMSLNSYKDEFVTYHAYINGLDSNDQCVSYEEFECRISNLSAVRSAWFSLTS